MELLSLPRPTKPLLRFFILSVALSASAIAQTAPDGTSGTTIQPPTRRPGLFRAGAWYFTPYLNIGTLGIDTNVFYTSTERQADFTASGGPGLEIIRPFRTTHRFRLDGGMNYLWFARTESQRRLNWYGSAALELEGVRTSSSLEGSYVGTYSRPNFEVDRRVQQDTVVGSARFVRRLAARWQLALWGGYRDTTTEDELYLGTNLGETLTEKRYETGTELRRALTVKTQLVGGGEHSWHVFPRLPERDGQSTLAYGGLRTDSSALISGQAVGGYRWFWPQEGSADARGLWYANVNATLNITSRTKLGATFFRDLEYSAFATATTAPSLVNEQLTVFFEKLLTSNVYVRLFARQIEYVAEDVIITPPGGDPITGTRSDRVREAGAELGYQFRSRVRMGVTAIYTERRSNIETFGIQGLLAGFTITYNPPDPIVR